MNSPEALSYLESFTNYEKAGLGLLKGNFGLSKMRKALELLGNPERSYKCVHIAGTKGKGSVSAFTASILRSHGRRTGLYTSPHLVSMNERISVDGKDISPKALAETVSFVKEKAGRYMEKEKFSFFEVYTLLAFAYFREKRVDLAVLECGLGGRLDATNVVPPGTVAITPISYDHMNVLGGTLSGIAREKAAIVKKKAFCVSARQRPKAAVVIREKAEKEGALLIEEGKDILTRPVSHDENGSVFDIITRRGRYRDCVVKMPGVFQPGNALLAVAVCEEALGAGFSEEKMREGLLRAFLPGRFEILRRSPHLVMDGAHNAHSALALAKSMREIFGRKKAVLVIALAADKDIKGFCAGIAPIAKYVIITRIGSKRAADPVKIASCIKGVKKAVIGGPERAVRKAISMAGKKGVVLVAGSFYLAGEVRDIFRKG
jgi:dihydrofolate synthase/folylpolyglutamate synthase